MKNPAVISIVLLSLCCARAPAQVPELPAFKSYDMLTYTLVTHDEFTAAHIPGQTARIDAFLTQQLATPVHTPNLPTRILVLPYKLTHRYFEVRDEVITDFVPARFANYLILRHSRNSNEIRNQLFHVYTHAFVRSQMKRYYPLWLEEGLATLISFSRFHYDEMEIGMPFDFSTPWIPLARLFEIDRDSPEYNGAKDNVSIHPGSWALVHMAFIEDAAFNKQLFDFLAALNNFNPLEKAVPQSFGMSVDELDQRMRRYEQSLARRTDAVFQVKIPPVPDPKAPRGRAMDEAESLTLLAEAMLAAGTYPERLGELVDAAYRKAPDSPKLLGLRMQLAVRDRDDASLGRLLTESEPRLSDAAVARAVGLALFERVRETRQGDTLSGADRERMSRKAFELLDRAVMSKPDDIEAIWGYAMLAARLKQDLPLALKRVDSGLAIADHNADLAMAAALIYEAQGEQKKMVPFLVVTARMTAEPKTRAWALGRVNEVLAAQAAAPAAAPAAKN
jgi:hypothetical protein